MPTIDVRNLPPKDRHPKITTAFEELDTGETLTLINDHDPKPLYYELKAEQDEFDAEGYEVTQEEPDKFVAMLPKK